MNANEYQNVNTSYGTFHRNKERNENHNGNMKSLDHIIGSNWMTLAQGLPSSVSAQDTISGNPECLITGPKKESDNGTISNNVSKCQCWPCIIWYAISSSRGGVSVSMLSSFYTKEAKQNAVTV